MVEPDHPRLSVARQCELLGMARSSFYYEASLETAENVKRMRLLGEQYTKRPYYGIRRMTEWLKGKHVGVKHKRVARLMGVLGLEGLCPKRNLSRPGAGHRVYPCLLRRLAIERPHQVWSTDITYVRMPTGFAYLMASLAWFSRYVVSWRLSNTMDGGFCLETLDEALSRGQPEICNSDQGAQFASTAFTGRLEQHGVRVSMDGRGRVYGNIFIERLWRTVKYEQVCLKDYTTIAEAFAQLKAYFAFYNGERLHQALGYRTPAEAHFRRGKKFLVPA